MRFDWRLAFAVVAMFGLFFTILAFPDTVPFIFIWAVAIGIAAFASPLATTAFGVLAAGLSLLAWALTDNFEMPLVLFRTVGFVILVAIAWFISQRRSRADELIRLNASRDSLTGLVNRRLLIERFDAQLKLREQHDYAGVIYADIDQFKKINDTAGHRVGDEVLVIASDRIQASVRAGDTVARFGGDEFVVALPDAGSAEGVKIVCERISTLIAEPIITSAGGRTASVTMGAAGAGNPSRLTPEELIDSADQQLMKAKASAPGTYLFVEL
ncbi:MAG TPA: hypothetical protein DDY88_05590 [Actinobacteria bacterium]|nr:hypothetical protein [Actinomycetota bacterium]